MIAVPLFSAVVSRTLKSLRRQRRLRSCCTSERIYILPPTSIPWVAERCGIYVGTQTNPLGVIPLVGLLLCREAVWEPLSPSLSSSKAYFVFLKKKPYRRMTHIGREYV